MSALPHPVPMPLPIFLCFIIPEKQLKSFFCLAGGDLELLILLSETPKLGSTVPLNHCARLMK